ncbi:MAG: DUF882 domain-containing protein [Sandaracinaceae bacterium]|nr:DUF882 domain-containing protein [Sandaracinaceae bacterium]
MRRFWPGVFWLLGSAAPVKADFTVIYSSGPPPPLRFVFVEPSFRDSQAPADAGTSPSCRAAPPLRFFRLTDGSRESLELLLTDCEGKPKRDALIALSVLARPRGVTRPSALPSDDALHNEEIAPGVRLLASELLLRLAHIAHRFPGHAFEIVSGHRPNASPGSRHRSGQALDIRPVDLPLEVLFAALLELDETGVGFYPNAGFVHVDVRQRVSHWVDFGAPGERSRIAEIVHSADGRASATPPLRSWLEWLATHPLPEQPLAVEEQSASVPKASESGVESLHLAPGA